MGDLPETMRKLPVGPRGLPVPYAAAWSVEHWHAIRHDPLVDHVAVFTAGRPGRGRPLYGVMNEPRQRRCVMEGRCGVCGDLIDGPGWLPEHPTLMSATAEIGGREVPVTTEPPCCHPCATWSATGCPGIAAKTTGLLRIGAWQPVAQLIDPSAAPGRHERRFDRDDDRDRLGRIARRHGGACGYVKVAVTESSTDRGESA